MKTRMRFVKCGSMKFIGHLDCMRFFQKAIRRAEIDLIAGADSGLCPVLGKDPAFDDCRA